MQPLQKFVRSLSNIKRNLYPDLVEHLKTFKSFGKRNKSLLIATLEDVQRELKSKNPNNKYMISLLNQIEKTTYFTDNLQKKMMLDAVISKKSVFQTEYVRVV